MYTQIVYIKCILLLRKTFFFKYRQELSYRQQIARQLRTRYGEGIYRHKYYTVVEFYLYPTVGTVLIHSVKPELTE